MSDVDEWQAASAAHHVLWGFKTVRCTIAAAVFCGFAAAAALRRGSPIVVC